MHCLEMTALPAEVILAGLGQEALMFAVVIAAATLRHHSLSNLHGNAMKAVCKENEGKFN